MGAQLSKTAGKEETVPEKPGEAAVTLSKANGQENGHVKVNGHASPATAEVKEELQFNGSAAAEEEGKAEAAPGEKEAVDGEKANSESSAPTDVEPAKTEDGATPSVTNETPPKKKRFSFKKSFKLSGFSFKKTKKETGDGSEEAVAAGSEEAKDEGVEAVEGESTKTADEATPVAETKPVEEPKATSPATEEPKPAEPVVETEPAPVQNEESALTVQKADPSPEVLAESATE